jgi:hypothetical protein
MIQRGDGFGFALEALAELRGRNLNGNVAIQPQVPRAVDLAHATRNNGCKDFIGSEFVACLERHVSESIQFIRSGSALRLGYGVSGSYARTRDFRDAGQKSG